MKNKILTAIAVMASLCGYAQTKGTSAVGFGMSSQTSKYESRDQSGNVTTNEIKGTAFSLSYGLFIKDNAKLGVDVNYGTGENNYVADVSGTKSNSYGAGVNYQHYYPLIKKLYAYAGGGISYGFSKNKEGSGDYEDAKTNRYGASVNGGVTWFVSKRFALETSLLSANASYMKTKRTANGSQFSSSYDISDSSFNVSSTGSISNLGFKVYVLF